MEKSILARDKISQAYLGLWGDAATQERAKNRIDWLAVNTIGSKVLDIGCSEGILPIMLGREGYQVLGIDVNPEALEYANRLLNKECETVRNNVLFQRANILASNNLKKEFDTVIIAEVIEHLLHPCKAIQKAVEQVKNNGRLLVTTPFGYFPDPDHHQTFTLTDVVNIVRKYCVIEHISVIDGYIRIIGKRQESAPTKRYGTTSLKNILHITENAAIDAQKLLRISNSRIVSQKVDLLGKINKRNQELNSKNQELNSKNQGLNSRNQGLNSKNQELNSKNQGLNSKNQGLNSKNQGLNSKNQGLNSKNQELNSKNQGLNSKNQELNSKNQEVNSRNRDLILGKKQLIEVNNTLRLKNNRFTEETNQLSIRIKNLETSEAWKIGHITVKAFSKPGKNTILWIPRLLKILLLRILQPNQLKQPNLLKKKVVADLSTIETRAPSIFTIKNASPLKIEKTESFKLRNTITANNLSDLRVACVMDEFTYNSYAPECDLLQLTTEEWRSEIEGFEPDLLFIESAWRGKDGLWNRKVNYPGGELNEVIAWCNRNLIPTVFWNKEDPVHFQSFVNRAKLFDFVFTTDIDCICSYKKALKSNRIYLLPFGAQPALHNPIQEYDRKDTFCFAGAYYPRYPDRMKDFDTFFSALSNLQGLDIYDRNYDDADSAFAFPNKYRAHIIGYLPHEKIDIAYKGYRYGVNMNSIKQSPTMFARRVFELIASNTITVSNYSKGVRDFFGNLVISTDDAKNLNNQLVPFRSDDVYYKKVRLMAQRKVLLEHTYGDRLAYVAEKVWDLPRKDTLPLVNVVGLASNADQFKNIVISFERQSYKNKKLIIVTTEKLNTVQTSDWIQIIAWNRACEMKTDKLISDGYISCFHSNDYYGEHYVLDMMLATKYTAAGSIGKSTIIAFNGKQYYRYSDGNEYKVVDKLPYRSSVIKAVVLNSVPLSEWLQNITSGEVENTECFSVDEFNYCKDYIGNVCPYVDDLEGVNAGLPLRDIEKIAERIKPVQERYRLTQLDGYKLQGLISGDTSGMVKLRKSHERLEIQSMLEGDKTITLTGQQYIGLDQIQENRNLNIFFDTSPGLKIQLILYLYDENLEKVAHKIVDANRNYKYSSLTFSMLQLGIRIIGKGSGAINRLVFDYVPRNDPFPSKAENLLITPQYPTYKNLYSFGFVHSRVIQYLQLGVTLDVLRINDGFAEEYFEFSNIDVISGSTDTLRRALDGRKRFSVLVHYLTQDMWDVLREFVGQIPMLIWLHGAEVQPWYRRKFNYTSAADEKQAKELSDQRVNLWNDVFSNLDSKLHFIFVSQYFANEVMEDNGLKLPKENYSVIHNTIDTDLFSYKPKSFEQRKRLLSIRSYASAKYANDLTVKSILELSKKSIFADLEIRIVGDGVLFEETLQPLRKFNNVIIEKRFLKQEEIAALNREYGIFLTPTRWDSQGVSRDEAMSSGLVPITNKVAAIPEFVDEQCGMIVDGEDYKGMAEAITRLYKDPDLFQRLSENAAARVRKQCSKEQTIVKEIDLIKKLSKNPIKRATSEW